MFTLGGFTVSTKAEAMSILMIAVLKKDRALAEQCKAVIGKM